MTELLLTMPDRQKEAVKLIAGQVDLPMSEVIRRFLDHCMTRPVLNVVFPCMSGSIRVAK